MFKGRCAMLFFLYIGVSLYVVLIMITVYFLSSHERAIHDFRLGKKCAYYRNMFSMCSAREDYRLTDKEIKELKNTLHFEAFYKVCREIKEQERIAIWDVNKDAMLR
ncbi:MAG: hypothetical protein IK078_12290, partial [Lachnospiraceae bacterium]|nr:hypothetical protein [Lachnospiraceae bacterium]